MSIGGSDLFPADVRLALAVAAVLAIVVGAVCLEYSREWFGRASHRDYLLAPLRHGQGRPIWVIPRPAPITTAITGSWRFLSHSLGMSLGAARRAASARGIARVGLVVLVAAVISAVAWAWFGPHSSTPEPSSVGARSQGLAAAVEPAAPGVVVPSTQGLAVRVARNRLEMAGLQISAIVPVAGRAGLVMRSFPTGGATVSRDQGVVLFVGVTKERLRQEGG